MKIDNKKHQAVGFDEGSRRAEEKLKAAFQINKVPTITIENILLQQENEWFDLSVLLLRDPEKDIYVKTYTQMTPIPLDQFLTQAETEMAEYTKGCDSIEKILSAYLQVLYTSSLAVFNFYIYIF